MIDVDWYRAQRPETPDDPVAVAHHYLSQGRRDGLSPNPLFRPDQANRRSWRVARVDPLVRYLETGSTRSTHPLFDPEVHLARFPEAADHPGGPLGHLLTSPVPLPTPAVEALGGETDDWPTVRARMLRAAADLAVGRDLVAPRWSATFDGSTARELLPVARSWLLGRVRADDPLVSIVMPVRDRRQVIESAIASVRAQSLSDWELVVVDDGSTDGTPAFVRELAADDPRIRVIERDHEGVSAARNTGIAAARGELLAFLDSDNQWRPDHLLVTAHALATEPVGAVHTVIHRENEDGEAYLAFEGTIEQLRTVNFVDMNALVMRTALAREVGGFDRSLRRMVDWDFVIRVAERAALRLVPYVGVDYSDDGEQADRISVREPLSWGRVVVAKHLVDWEAAERRKHVPGRVSVLTVVQDEWRRPVVAIDRLLEEHPDGLEVVVVDNVSPDTTWEVLRARYDGDPRVVLVRLPRTQSTAVGLDAALAAASGEFVLLHDHRYDLSTDAIDGLVTAMADVSVVAAQPVVQRRDGTVADAGYVCADPAAMPFPLLRGHAVEDALVDATRRVHVGSDVSLLLRTREAIQARGVDPLFEQAGGVADLCLRLGGVDQPRVLVVSGARSHEAAPRPGGDPVDAPPEDARLFLQRWGSLLPSDAADHYAALGFSVAHLRPTSAVGQVEPVVVHPRASAALRVHEQAPLLRWSLKVAAPAGRRGEVWGDVHFAESLARSLRALGQHVAVDRAEAATRATGCFDDVMLVIRGLLRVDPQPDSASMLWVISHPELLTPAELAQYDHVFAASEPWSRRMTDVAGVCVEPLLQATDPELFHPGRRGTWASEDVLFVGSSRNVFRPIIRDALESDVPVAIYGPRWEQFLGPGAVAGEGIPNDRLGGAYASAGVVLNDHWTEMAEQGFLSNRLFDAVAAGAVVVSDRVAGAQDVFGGMVQMYDSPADLRRLTGPGRDQWFPASSERAERSAAIRREHSFGARAARLVEQAALLHARREADQR